jgi:hypothetical protein
MPGGLINFKQPKFPFNIPFFLLDIDNMQLITVPTIPSDISDVKSIIYSEVPVPGMNFQPVQIGGAGNRKLSFTLPLIRRNNSYGNVLLLKQFDMLRNQKQAFYSLIQTGQFTGFPKVLFYWGTGSIPMIYYVAKCDALHKHGWTNSLGQPQYTEIAMELWLDENNPVYKGEQVFRKLMSVIGMVDNTSAVIKAQVSKKFKPY